MSKRTISPCRVFSPLVFAVLILFSAAQPGWCFPLTFTDDGGHTITLTEKPKRAVSLSPEVTDMIFAIGADSALAGVTHHTTLPPRIDEKTVVGGFLHPSFERIEMLRPDVIFISPLQQDVRRRFSSPSTVVIELNARTISEIYPTVELLGLIFNRSEAARRVIDDMRRKLDLINKKMAKIPESGRRRVIGLLSSDPVIAPGDYSFQNEFIKAAGGIPPVFNNSGDTVNVTLEEWKEFNPQLIYVCGVNEEDNAKAHLDRPGWRDVDAMKNGMVYSFPCALTGRVSTNAQFFIPWLAARIYSDGFGAKNDLIFPDEIVKNRTLNDIDLDYVDRVSIMESRIYDFTNKTLLIDFKEPMTVVSTLEGQRSNIRTVGNHYIEMPGWAVVGMLNFDRIKDHIHTILGKRRETTALLFTGANMDNLSIQKVQYKKTIVYALVTAGVTLNAVRMSVDKGRWHEGGTINIILLTNRKLTPRAMTRAIISATEGKTAALENLDVRSSFSAAPNQATGTGTDNIIVVEGRGAPVNLTGGHSKMGELIAKAVYAGVMEAIYRQNGSRTERNIFRRLQERKINVYELAANCPLTDPGQAEELGGQLEGLLLEPRTAAFLETAFALSDAWERGLVRDLGPFESMCRSMAEEIAGKPVADVARCDELDRLPRVLSLAFGALINGATAHMRDDQGHAVRR